MKTVLIYSGGLDSTVLLYQLKAQGHDVHALSVNYGQRHRRELDCASSNCSALGVAHQLADLSGLQALMTGSALTDSRIEVPLGHYAAETMKATVVPNRNMLLLSVATAWAITLKAETVSYAAHSGDHAIYPDCRPEFADAVDQAMRIADWHPVSLHSPFIGMSKAEIVALGDQLGVPFGDTWSCYQGKELHCGACGTCIERREAFYLSQVHDPTLYAPDAVPRAELIAHGWRLP